MKIVLFANTDWYLYNFRLPLARALRSQGHDLVLLSPPGEYSRYLKEAGFRWVGFPLSRRGLNPFNEAGTLWRLFCFYRSQRPDVAHNFTVKCVLYGTLAARLAGTRRIINAVTGLGFVFLDQRQCGRVIRWLVRKLYRFALKNTLVIFQNPEDRKLFTQQNLVTEAQSIMIKSSGVDIHQFTPSPEPEGIPLVILPARMLWDKGIGEFVDVARHLQDAGVSARFALVGDCDPDNPSSVSMDKLSTWVKEEVVEWWGWREDMAAVYACSNIVCLPSYREGVPKTLIEAAACGRAIVATDVPGCREVVHDGQNGLLVPLREPEALVSALRRLIKDKALRQEMGYQSRAIAEAEFSSDLIVSKTLKVYEQIIN